MEKEQTETKANYIYTLHETVRIHRFRKLRSVPSWYICDCGLVAGWDDSEKRVIPTSFINIASWDHAIN